jgi:hypothetical protein
MSPAHVGVSVSDDELRLIGWLLTDGSVSDKDVSIYQSKPQHVDAIRELLLRLNLEHSEYSRCRNQTVVCGKTLRKPSLRAHHFRLKAPAAQRVRELLPSKELPNWAHQLTDRQFAILLETIIAGDGVWDGANCAVVYKDEAFLSALQGVAVQHGWRSRLALDNRGHYRLCLSPIPHIRIEKKTATTTQYEGEVWCLRVPLGNFMVRRKGTAYFTGNSRYESHIANKLPEYELVKGVHLKDHFSPRWRPCWSVVVGPNTRSLSPNHIVVKHRYKGGLHASTTNLRDSGTSMATGHTHALEVRAVSDYTGTKFGINTGMLADPQGEQFEYLEDVPRNWRAGFVVCTYTNGRLLWPEIVSVVDQKTVSWRGQLVSV